MATESILGRAKIPISGDLTQLDKDLSSARSKVSGAIKGIVGTIEKIGVAGIAAGTVAAAGLAKIAIDAAPVEGLASAFEGLAKSSGKSMNKLLAALKKGSSGMISQRDLMASYNTAAQLVGTTFANQLPDAMQYLSKVSAATGQDMGFMLDSLVKGVGRLSPMILDNLGIQVSLEEATARAAEMFGVEAEQLEKGQIQAGMMNVVLEKLAANTAAMPEVTETAAARMAQLKASFQDVKDQIGIALLPALEKLGGMLVSALSDPKFQEAVANIAQWFGDNLPKAIGEVVNWLSENVPKAVAAAISVFTWLHVKVLAPLLRFINEYLIPGLREIYNWFKEKIPEAYEALKTAIQRVAAELEPAFTNIKTAIDKLTPALDDLKASGVDPLEVATKPLEEVWNRLKDLLGWHGGFIKGTLTPAVSDLATTISDRLIPGMIGWFDNIKKDLGPALEWLKLNVVDPLNDSFNRMKSIIQELIDWVGQLIDKLNFSLPDWLTPGSPTPLELGLRGIADAMRDLGSMQFPALGVEMQAAVGGVEAGGVGAAATVQIYFQVERMEVSSRESAESEARTAGYLIGEELRRRGLLGRMS